MNITEKNKTDGSAPSKKNLKFLQNPGFKRLVEDLIETGEIQGKAVDISREYSRNAYDTLRFIAKNLDRLKAASTASEFDELRAEAKMSNNLSLKIYDTVLSWMEVSSEVLELEIIPPEGTTDAPKSEGTPELIKSAIQLGNTDFDTQEFSEKFAKFCKSVESETFSILNRRLELCMVPPVIGLLLRQRESTYGKLGGYCASSHILKKFGCILEAENLARSRTSINQAIQKLGNFLISELRYSNMPMAGDPNWTKFWKESCGYLSTLPDKIIADKLSEDQKRMLSKVPALKNYVPDPDSHREGSRKHRNIPLLSEESRLAFRQRAVKCTKKQKADLKPEFIAGARTYFETVTELYGISIQDILDFEESDS
jgi:hypothetical protein